MKIKEFCNIYKEKIAIIAVILVAILILVVGGVFFLLPKGANEKQPDGQKIVEELDMAEVYESEDFLMMSGRIHVGTSKEKFEVEDLEEGLWVEKVYINDGAEFQEADRILKFSEESVDCVREELEQNLRDAEFELYAFEMEYEKSKITLRYDKDRAVLEGKQAKDVYEDTVEELSIKVENAQDALDEAKSQIKEYEKIVNGKSSQAPFYVDKYKKIYDDNAKILTKKMDEYGYTWNEVVYGSGTATPSEQLAVLQKFYKVLEQNLLDYEQAQADYEDAVADAKLNVQTLELGLSSLEAELTQAKADYDAEVLQAELALEQKKTDAERAQSDYVAKLQKLESDYKLLMNAKEDAEENLEKFEKTVGNGYYYAEQGGTMLQMELKEEQYLTSGSTMFHYSNPQKMTVTLSVEQAYIGKLAVGDTAYIKTEEEGSFQGIVAEINMASEADSNAEITYDVTVAIGGEIEQLKADEPVTVMFRIGGTANEEAN